MPVPALTCRTCRSSLLGLLMTLVVCASSGCVQRRMMIRSNPPGAQVSVDGYEVGTTPVPVNFTYYGIRKIQLAKDGYETLTVMQPVAAPWYQVPPLDFFSENFVAGDIRDNHTFDYNLTPQLVVPTDQILEHAERLRSQSRASGAPQAGPAGSPYPVRPTPPLPSPAPPFTTAPLPSPAPAQPLEPPGGWR